MTTYLLRTTKPVWRGFSHSVLRCYDYVLTIPDRAYPFRSEIEGQWVRGRKSYDYAIAAYRLRTNKLGYGYKIVAYRQVFHFVGSIIAIVLATFLSKHLFGSETSLFLLLSFVVIFITYQEFSLQPRTHSQRWQKGITDWLVWLGPIAYYIYLILSHA